MLQKLKEVLGVGETEQSGKTPDRVKYPGVRDAVDGNTAVIHVEREASDAAGAYPITPSTQMGEYWAEEAARGHLNIRGRPLIFVEPESEHAAAGVTAGMAMTGLRAVNFSSAQGVAFMHESLYAAVGKRLPYVLNMGCRAITKATLNVHCGHDDFHCVDDTGFIQAMARDAQAAADLNLIARKTAELALTPAIVGQDGFLTTHLIESARLPERALVAEFLGRPDDLIDTPTPAQRLIYGPQRRRVPALWDVDAPLMSGVVQNQDAYMQAVAAQRPYFFDHIRTLWDACATEYHALTGRRYERVRAYRCEDAEYLIVGLGSMTVEAEAVADYLRATRKLKVGVIHLTLFRPFPGDLLGKLLSGKRGVAVLERTDQPLAEDLPLMRETRAALGKCLENGAASESPPPWPGYAAYAHGDLPQLYSGVYGLGSRDLQPEALIGAVENMLPGGARRKRFYLSMDFLRPAANPQEEVRNQQLAAAYPDIVQLAVRGSENPNLLPTGAIAVRLHSIGGWGAITAGKNLAVTLFQLLGFEIKANPKYGSEKKGQPTTYYLCAAPEPIRVNCEYQQVDVALSPDPAVFGHCNPLAGLKRGGVFIIQSSLAERTWENFPDWARRQIIEQDLRVFYLDAFKIAREEAGSPALQLRMQGNAFQGAFFAAFPLPKLSEDALFQAIEAQLREKFGAKGAQVVDNNLRVVRRGFCELHEITDKPELAAAAAAASASNALPVLLKRLPAGRAPLGDIHRFWRQTGHAYLAGQGGDNPADPFAALALMPAATGVFRDMTSIRFEHPVWVDENCTACGNCFTQCPDAAIPGLVNSLGEVLETALRRVEAAGAPTRYLRRAIRAAEKHLRRLIETNDGPARPLIDRAFSAVIDEAPVAEREVLAEEFTRMQVQLGGFQFAAAKPYWNAREKKAKGSGGLFSITVNPYACKACGLCVTVCADQALHMAPQTEYSVSKLRRDWDFWLDLPTTAKAFSRIDDLDEKVGALETLLLDKQNYLSMHCGDGACLGCGEKTAIHLFTSTVAALMQPRVAAFVARLDELIVRFEQHIRIQLMASVDVSDTQAMIAAAQAAQGRDLTISGLTAKVSEGKPSRPLDPDWVRWTARVLERLKSLRACYTADQGGPGRAPMGVVNSTGCTSVWGSTWPFNPYPFPWSSHLFQDSPSVAMGVFEGHMAKMAEGFKTVRMAEMELSGEYLRDKHEDEFRRFGWRQFSEEEWRLCPPVVALGGDGAMYDIGFQNLSRALMSGMPIKVLVVDTQVYSNTGGQACTSGFTGQVSDMAPFGPANRGKQETRKEISLIGMAHRTAYVLQSTIAHPTHLIEGYIDGLNSRRPALFNIYAVCPPEHGVGDDRSVAQSKLAVEGRAYPLFKYDPDAGQTLGECVSLEGNPALEDDWPRYGIDYLSAQGEEQRLDVPLTFADFAATETRFAKHFRTAPASGADGSENGGGDSDDLLPLAEYLALEADARFGKTPFIWAADSRRRLVRLLVSEEMARASAERLGFWRQLQGLANVNQDQAPNAEAIRQARTDLLTRIYASLGLTGQDGGLPADGGLAGTADSTLMGGNPQGNGGDYEAVWVETPECTACDECITLAPKVFAYNPQKLATVVNPRGAKYADLVKAAEKCTAGCIHPGTPWNPAEPGLTKLLARAAKYN